MHIQGDSQTESDDPGKSTVNLPVRRPSRRAARAGALAHGTAAAQLTGFFAIDCERGPNLFAGRADGLWRSSIARGECDESVDE